MTQINKKIRTEAEVVKIEEKTVDTIGPLSFTNEFTLIKKALNEEFSLIKSFSSIASWFSECKWSLWSCFSSLSEWLWLGCL